MYLAAGLASRPNNFGMRVVEIRVVHVAPETTRHPLRQSGYADSLAVFDDTTQRLKLDKAID